MDDITTDGAYPLGTSKEEACVKEIDRLAKWFLNGHSEHIQGSAVDSAIALMEKLL